MVEHFWSSVEVGWWTGILGCLMVSFVFFLWKQSTFHGNKATRWIPARNDMDFSPKTPEKDSEQSLPAAVSTLRRIAVSRHKRSPTSIWSCPSMSDSHRSGWNYSIHIPFIPHSPLISHDYPHKNTTLIAQYLLNHIKPYKSIKNNWFTQWQKRILCVALNALRVAYRCQLILWASCLWTRPNHWDVNDCPTN